MVDEEPGKAAMTATESIPVPARGWRRRLARGAAMTLASALTLLVAIVLLLDTPPGRRLVAEAVQAYEFQNGMRIGIGRIEGSLYGAMVIHDLSLNDPEGEFLYFPKVDFDWQPLGFIADRLEIRSAAAGRGTLHRLPELRETPPSDEPLLPGFDIELGALRVDRLIIEKPVTGERRVATLSGKADVADGRAIIHLAAETIAVDGGASGDSLAIRIDAIPEQDQLAIEARIDAPQGGVLAVVTGLNRPLSIGLTGGGTWKQWDGKLSADSGSDEIARFQLAARDGRFTLKGPAWLSPMTGGIARRLLTGEAQFDLATRLDDGAVALDGEIASDIFRLRADGTVHFSDNRFDGLHLGLDLRDPAALADHLAGTGLTARLTLDGDFRAPGIRYAIAASSLAYGEIALRQLAATGTARIEKGRIHVPVAASVQQVTGLDREAGGAIEAVALTGDVTIDGTRMLAEKIRLRSNRMDASGLMIADLGTGQVSGTLAGQVAGYRLESVAILNLDADGELEAGGTSGFGLAGRIRARSTSLLNDGLRQLLGGDFAAAGDVRYSGGTLRLANMRLVAPYLSVVRGQGVLGADGKATLDADATSERYGRVALRLTGSLANPDARITAERPGLGIGLAGLEARITGIEDGLRFAVTAATDYGPLVADVGLATRGPLELRINHADLSGVGFSGSILRTAQGPFAGTLRADGNGLGGIVKLDAEGSHQAARFSLRSTGSVFRGPVGLAVGSAIVDGTAVFYDRPHVVADAQLADLRTRDLDVAAARLRIDYRDGRGQVKALLEAGGALPFRLAANATLQPDIWTLALQGKVRGIAVATASPAKIRPGQGSYDLLPTKLSVGKGTIQLSGSYGKAASLRALLDNIDLALVDAFVPGFGAGGKASGSLAFEQAGGGQPQIDASLKFANFTRSTALAVSQPVDVILSGKLLEDRGEVRAVLRTSGGVAGRLQAFLEPAPGRQGGWQSRMRRAALSGGFRYNGPADTLLSFAGQPGQRLTGTIAVAADLSCRLDEPCLSGIVRGSGLTYENRTLGTRLSAISVNGRFEGDRLLVESLTATAGSGTVDASGQVSLSSARGFPLDLALDFDSAQLARSDTVSASASGQLRLTKTAGQKAMLKGTLRLPDARYRIVRESAVSVSQLSGVRFLPAKGRRRITGDELPVAVASVFADVGLDIDITAPGRLFVSGMGLESEWSARFKLLGSPERPRLDGSFTLQRGTLGFAGRSFKLTKGTIRFSGRDEIDPELSLTAVENVGEVAVTTEIGGRASNPRIAFSSVPGLPEDEILSRILFGRSIASLGPLQAVQLAASLNTLRGSGKGVNPLGKLRSASGIDRLRIVAADEETGKGTAFAAGQHITDNVYVELVTDARGFSATQLEVSLTPWLSVLSQAGGSGGNSVNVRIRKDY